METANKLIPFIQELRKYILWLTGIFLLLSVSLYFVSSGVLLYLQDSLHQKLVFFAVSEPFLAHVKIALFLAVLISFPLLSAFLWQGLTRAFKLSMSNKIIFVVFSCLLFYSGVLFCFKITLPFGVSFLLSYGSDKLQPVIAISRFVNFVTMFIIAFGLIFELPIMMVFAARSAICTRKTFVDNRRYALLIISIVAALLTPTPDIFNMLLMGGPLYFLYETGIFTLTLLKIP